MYVDSHQHFWKLSRGDYSWMSADYKPLYKDFFPSDLEPIIRPISLTETILKPIEYYNLKYLKNYKNDS